MEEASPLIRNDQLGYTNESNEDERVSESYNESVLDEEYFKINQVELDRIRLKTENSKTNKITEAFENLLCSKLIISKDSNMLILKPFFSYDILFYLRNLTNVNIKLEIVEKFNWLIYKIHTNAYILTNKSNLSHSKTHQSISFMNELVDILIENNRENVFSEKLLQFIERVIYLSGIKVKYIRHLLEKISDLFDKDKYDGNRFVLCLKLLNRMFQKTIHDGQEFPEKFFFFNNTNSELKVDTETLQYKNISIVKGYSIFMWIRAEHINLDSSNKKIIDSSLLYYIHTSKYISFQVFLKNKSVYYRIVNNINESKEESNIFHIFDIEYEKWTLLVFSHKPSSFLQKSEFVAWKGTAENVVEKSVEFPNVKSHKILSVGFFKDFTGQVSNVFMLNEFLSNHNVVRDLSQYHFGLYSERNIRIFKEFILSDSHNSKSQIDLKQFFDSILFIYSPCRMKRNSICCDLIDNINGEINITAEGSMLVGGVVNDTNFYNSINILGGLKILLPIFEFFGVSQFISTSVLEEALNLIKIVIDKKDFFITHPNSDVFFTLLGFFFENYDKSVFSREIVNQMLHIAEIISRNERNPKEYFKYFLLNPKIFIKFEVGLQIELWKNFYDLYSKRITVMNGFFDAKDVFEIIVKVYDNDINLYCCEEHYKMLCEKTNKNLVIMNPPLETKINFLLMIIEMTLTTNKIIAIEQMRQIIPYLSYEISPCLQRGLLVIFQKIFSRKDNIINKYQSGSLDETMRSKYISAFIKAKGLEHILYIVNISTLDVRLECLKLFDILTKIPSLIEDDYIPFIVHSIFPLKTPIKPLSSDSSKEMNEKHSLGKEDFFDHRDALMGTINQDTMKFPNEDDQLSPDYIIARNKTPDKFIEKSTLMQVNEIINMDMKHSVNSLNDLEEDYWQIMIKGNIVKSLNIPTAYTRHYSNERNDFYLESMYDYLLKWLTNNYDERKENTDDADVIWFEPAINLIMKLIVHANIVHKQKCLVDLLMLTVYNKYNCHLLIKNKYFYQWLLDLILPYQILLLDNFTDHKQSGLAATIVELGAKIHTNLIINSILYEQEKETQNEKLTNENKSSKIMDHSLNFQFMLTWMYKIRKISSNLEGKASVFLVRYLLTSLINIFKDYLKLMSPSYKFPIWQNFLNLSLIIYEFVAYSNFDRKIQTKQINFDLFEKNEILGEIIQNLNYDYEGKDFTQNNQSLSTGINLRADSQNSKGVAMIDIWMDKELFYSLYDCYKGIWDESVFKLDKRNSSVLNDEIKFVENLLNKIIFDNKPNFYIEDLKILLFSSSTDTVSLEQSRTNNIMRAILNFIIVTIRLSGSTNEVRNWVKELQKFTLFIISATENAKLVENSQLGKNFIQYAQDETAHALSIVFNFLIDELNSPRSKNSEELTEIFSSTLRFIFIYFTFIIEKVNILIQSIASDNSSSFFSYFNSIKNALLIRPAQTQHVFSPCWKLYSLYLLDKMKNRIFSIEDIREFKLNKFLDIPEKFKTESWIHAFQENNSIYVLLKNQFNFPYFDKLIRTRIFQAEFLIPNSEICINEKSYVNKVYKIVSNSVKESLVFLEEKFKLEIFETFVHKDNSLCKWNKNKKQYFQWRGKWCNLDAYLKLCEDKKIKFKIANHLTKSLSKPILFPVFSLDNYFPKFTKFENNIFTDIKEKFTKRIQLDKGFLSSIDDENFETSFDLKDPHTKSKVSTNKALLFYTDSEFADFVDKYSDIEKLGKFFTLFYNDKMKPQSIINITETFTKQNMFSNLYDVCIVKLKGHKKGRLILTGSDVKFIKDTAIDPDTKCVDGIFPLIDRQGTKSYFVIGLNEIRQIHKRRFFYKKTACEIYTTRNKSFFINFNSSLERDSFCKLISENQISKDNPYLFEYHLDLKKNQGLINKIIKEWSSWNMSNFDFLMNLNSLSGRSFIDLTQYPVFPWILNDYSSVNKKTTVDSIRDLSKPLGALGDEGRKNNFINVFHESLSNQHEEMFNEGVYFYNSHYSNPYYVCNFLARLLPYAACAIELQGNGFDHPQRQFLSVSQAFRNSMTETTDLRELLPEFYYLPEMFVNMNKIDFGMINDKYIEDVAVPFNDPYLFVISNRLNLETDIVSSQINEWIELIFGIKQRGKEAETAMNLFWKFTYEDEIDIDDIMNNKPDEYHSYISKIFMGQTPSQIIMKPLNKRANKETSKKHKMFIENKKNLRVYNSTSEVKNKFKTRKDILSKLIIKIKSLENDRLICVYNNGLVQLMKVDDTPYSLSRFIFIREKEVTMTKPRGNTDESAKNILIKTISDEDDSIMKEINYNQPVKILSNGKHILKGGYYDGKFLLYDMNKEECHYYSTEEDSKVTCIESDEGETLLLVGSSSGRIYCYDIVEGPANSIIRLKSILSDHDGHINSIVICNRLNVVATIANDKTCNLYTYPDLFLFRVIKHPSTSFEYLFLSINPLPSVILYSQSDLNFFCYSINGHLMHVESDGVKYLFSPQITQDAYSRDHLIYGTENGNIIVRPLPFLTNSWKIELNKSLESGTSNLPIKCFDLSKDKRSIYFWQLEDFNISVIRDPKESKKKREISKDPNTIRSLLQKHLFEQ